jgi:hypothetical protein
MWCMNGASNGARRAAPEGQETDRPPVGLGRQRRPRRAGAARGGARLSLAWVIRRALADFVERNRAGLQRELPLPRERATAEGRAT